MLSRICGKEGFLINQAEGKRFKALIKMFGILLTSLLLFLIQVCKWPIEDILCEISLIFLHRRSFHP
jgi:hypothetical protein